MYKICNSMAQNAAEADKLISVYAITSNCGYLK